MATARQIRVLALQALYALDASDGRDPEGVRAALTSTEDAAHTDDGPRGVKPPTPPAEFSAGERRRAFESALSAWTSRQEADEFFAVLAPTWPANRQPIIDRSILRLSWQELRAGKTAARIVVDEAIEIAREYSTEKSPAFVNALLDKALKHFEDAGWAADDTDDSEEPAPDDDHPAATVTPDPPGTTLPAPGTSTGPGADPARGA